jgi:hypothetical protein
MWWLAACDRPEHLAPRGDVSLAEAELRLLGSAPVDDEDAQLGYYGLAVGDLDGRPGVVATDFGGGARVADLVRGEDRLVGNGFVVSVAAAPVAGRRGDALALGWRLDRSYDTRTTNVVASVLPADARSVDDALLHLTHDDVPTSGTVDYQVQRLGDALAVRADGRAWVFRGLSRDAELEADADLRIAGDRAQVGALAVGDLDDDGRDDLVAVLGDGVVVGPWPRTGQVTLAAALPGVDVPGQGWGGEVAVGDVTGDGVTDLVVVGGAVWVFAGPIRGRLDPGDAVARLDPLDDPALAFFSAAVADVDGDGVGDLVAGAPGDATSEPGGAVAVWYGPVDGVRTLPEADARLLGETPGDAAGYRVAAADGDGDGYEDLVIDAVAAESGRGAVYVLRGGPR